MADEQSANTSSRKEPAPRVIEGSAKVIAEEPVDHPNSPPPANEGPAHTDTAAAAPAEPQSDLQDSLAQADAASAVGTDHPLRSDPEPERAAKAPPPRVRRRWGIYAFGVAAVGAALIAIAWFGPFGSNGPTPPAVDPRLSALDSKLVSSEQHIATLDRRLVTVETSVQQLGFVQKQVADTIASTARKLDDTNASLSDAANTAKAAAAVAQAARNDAVEARLSSSRDAADVGKTVDLKPLQDRIARLEAILAQPKVEGKAPAEPVVSQDANKVSLDHAAALAVVAQAIIQAIDRGEPFSRQVAAMERLGAYPNQLAVLKPLADSGVSTAQSLSLKFVDLAKNMTPAAEADMPKSEDFLGRIWQQTTHLVRIRPVGGSAGESGGVIARIEAALGRGDAVGALTEWEKLPASAKTISEKWASDLKSRTDAAAAASTVLASAIGNLGKPKS
jgi:hypothetical protein